MALLNDAVHGGLGRLTKLLAHACCGSINEFFHALIEK